MRMIGVAGFLIPLVSILARGDAPAGAALALRPPRHGAQAAAAAASRPTPEHGLLGAARALDHATAARCSSSAAPALLVAAAVPAFWLQLTPGLDVRDPALAAVGPRLRRAPAGGRPGRGRAGAGARRTAPRGAVLAPGDAGRGRAARRRRSQRDPEVAAVYDRHGRPLRRREPDATSRCSSPAATTTASRRRRRSCSGCATD